VKVFAIDEMGESRKIGREEAASSSSLFIAYEPFAERRSPLGLFFRQAAELHLGRDVPYERPCEEIRSQTSVWTDGTEWGTPSHVNR
jgi:hypothetical protein